MPQFPNGPSLTQKGYLADLYFEARQPPQRVYTFDQAKEEIKRLQRLIPIKQKTRGSLFVALKEGGKTYEDAKLAVGVESLSADKGATEYDGRRAIRWAKGFSIETRRVPVAEACAEVMAPDPVEAVARAIFEAPASAIVRTAPPAPVTAAEPPVPEISPDVPMPRMRAARPPMPAPRPVPVPAVEPEPVPPPAPALPLALTEPYKVFERREPPHGRRNRVVLNIVKPAEIVRLTVGVTPRTAHAVLQALWERGAHVDPIGNGPYLKWGLTVGQRNLLGLMPPARQPWGSVKNCYANSHFWSRNWRQEFELIREEIAA